jgi:hypothetical protein
MSWLRPLRDGMPGEGDLAQAFEPAELGGVIAGHQCTSGRKYMTHKELLVTQSSICEFARAKKSAIAAIAAVECH